VDHLPKEKYLTFTDLCDIEKDWASYIRDHETEDLMEVGLKGFLVKTAARWDAKSITINGTILTYSPNR
jgi:hypothetical protein